MTRTEHPSSPAEGLGARDNREVEDIERLASSRECMHWSGILRIIARMRAAEAALSTANTLVPGPSPRGAGPVSDEMVAAALDVFSNYGEPIILDSRPGMSFQGSLRRMRAALEAALALPLARSPGSGDGEVEALNLSDDTLALIRKSPDLTSLLYDLDLLPEQLHVPEGDAAPSPGLIRAWHRLYGVIYAWRARDMIALTTSPAQTAPDAGWRPPETAPKDGSEIWGRLLDSSIKRVSWWTGERCAEEHGGEPEDYEEGWYDDDNDDWNLRFWLPGSYEPWPPLPAGPSETEGGR